MVAKWQLRHITHFLLLKNFQEIGFFSTKVRNSIIFLSEASQSIQVEELLQLQQFRVLAQRSLSRQNVEPIYYFDTAGTLPFAHSGIVALNDKARIRADSIPHEQKICLFPDSCIILKPEQIPVECIYLQDNKYIALGYTKTYNCTYIHLFALKVNYVLKTQIKDAYQRFQGLTPIKLGSRVTNYDLWAKSSPSCFSK